jgi:hypothetical protein
MAKAASKRGVKDDALAFEKLHIVHVDIATLNPSPYNPRKMSENDAKQLLTSISKFGFKEPIIVNKYPGRENVIVGGHMRTRAAKALGYTQVPAVYVNLPEPEERELNLRLNRNVGEWDWDMLANHFEMPTLVDVGFTPFELGKHFDLDHAGDGDTGAGIGAMSYQIVITCTSEANQRELLERFDKEGLPCRALIL